MTTKDERADLELQRRREDLAIKYAQRLESKQGDPGAWRHLARHYGHKEMQIQGLHQPEIRTNLVDAISLVNFPCTKQGFFDYLEQCRNDARERMDKTETKAWTPSSNRRRVALCWRIGHPKKHYYRLLSNTNQGDFYATTPDIVAALETLLPKALMVGSVLDVDIEVEWDTNREHGNDDYPKVYRQIVSVKLPELSAEDVIDLNDIVEAIGVDKFAEVPDCVTDAMTLDSLHLRGWLGFQRNGVSQAQYKVPAKTAAKAGIDMTAKDQVELSNYYKSKRIACNQTPDAPLGKEGLSGILGVTTAMFFSTGGTLEKGKELVDAKMNPQIEAYEKSKAEKPPSPLDAFIPRDANNQPDGAKAECPICHATGEQEGRKCTLCGGDGWVWADEVDNGAKAKPVEDIPETGSIKTSPRTGETFGKLWSDVDKLFKTRGFKMTAWRTAADFKMFEVGKTDEQIIADANAWIDNVIATTKADIKTRAEDRDANPIAPTEKATSSNDDVVSGEIVSETPKSLTVTDKQIAKYQPNPYWLTSPQWQVTPFEMAKFVAESRLFKNADSAAKALAIIFKGIEIGIGPMAALEHLNIIDGKPPSCDGALMLALLRKSGIRVEFIERTDKICKLKMTRPDNGDFIITQFTFEEAQKAGLTGKPNWKYARAMLTWRTVSEGAKLIASDLMIIGGIPMYTHEEINPDAVLNEDGSLAA